MDYYLHDTNTFEDEKITELFIIYGYEALGLYYTLLEKLAKHEKPIKTTVLKSQLFVGKRLNRCWQYMEKTELIYSVGGYTFTDKISVTNNSKRYANAMPTYSEGKPPKTTISPLSNVPYKLKSLWLN